jgi:hypothetical protein
MNMKAKLALFAKIQLVTFIIGIAFIFHGNVSQGMGLTKALHVTSKILYGANLENQKPWIFLLPFYGTCLFLIRTDLVSQSIWSVFKKWSLIFFILQFTTDWTMYGWDKASADFSVMILRYISGGALAAGVWWLIECSPRLQDQGAEVEVKNNRSNRSKKKPREISD